MSANAVKVLDHLGLRPKFEPTAVRPKAFEFRRFDSGELLHGLPLGELHENKHGAPGVFPDPPQRPARRAAGRRRRALDAQAIVLDAKAVRIEEDMDGATAHFERAAGRARTCW